MLGVRVGDSISTYLIEYRRYLECGYDCFALGGFPIWTIYGTVAVLETIENHNTLSLQKPGGIASVPVSPMQPCMQSTISRHSRYEETYLQQAYSHTSQKKMAYYGTRSTRTKNQRQLGNRSVVEDVYI